jgi:ribonucleoside-diphosphate reductase beta chain
MCLERLPVTAVPEPYDAGSAELFRPVHSLPDLRHPGGTAGPRSILGPGLDVALRPMRYPEFYERYRDAVRNTWAVEGINLSDDLADLSVRLLPPELHLVRRLVAFLATRHSIVGNDVVLSLYKRINAPEARLYLSRQLFEEAQHVQFYRTLLGTYITDPRETAEAFAAIEHVPSIKAKADFCSRWINTIEGRGELSTASDRRQFLLNLICFAGCIQGIFSFAAFTIIYFWRSRGLLNGLAGGTNWVFRDESSHIDFAFAVVDTVRSEEPELFDGQLASQVSEMMADAVDAETRFAADLLADGVPGLSLTGTRCFLEYVADQRLARAGFAKRFGARNPFPFMQLQDAPENVN